MQHIAYRHFNIIFKIFFFGGAQNLTLPPGASYPRYATAYNNSLHRLLSLPTYNNASEMFAQIVSFVHESKPLEKSSSSI